MRTGERRSSEATFAQKFEAAELARGQKLEEVWRRERPKKSEGRVSASVWDEALRRATVGDFLRKEGWSRGVAKSKEGALGFVWDRVAVRALAWETGVWVTETGCRRRAGSVLGGKEKKAEWQKRCEQVWELVRSQREGQTVRMWSQAEQGP